jgi:acyl-CoA dehydrogenase-like protein
MWRADALSELNTYARNGRLMVAASFVGMTEAMFDLCVERLGTRFRGGRPLVDYPNVERTIGEMKVAVETAKAMLYRGLDATRSSRDAYFDPLSTAAKHYAFEAALKVGEHLMNLHGGEGYMRANPWELFVRDIMGGFGGQGAQELLLIQLGQRMVHTSEMRRAQEEAADRQLCKLSDAWVAVTVAGSADAPATGLDEPSLAAMREVLAAVGLEPGETPERDAVRALLETSAAIVEEARAGRLTDRLTELEDRAGSVAGALASAAGGAASFTALAAALESGVLDDLVLGRTAGEIAERLGVSEGHVTTLLGHLAEANLVRDADEVPALAPGLGWLATGGPRRSRFEHEIRSTLALGRALDGGGPPPAGGAVGFLCDHFLERLLPELVGLEERLCVPGARILVASDEVAAELGRRLPRAALSDLADPGGEAFAFAWLDDPVPGLSAAGALLDDGAWVVMPAAQGGDELGDAVQRLSGVLRTGRDIRGEELEALFVEQGFAGVTTLPGPPGARTGFAVGRKK